MVLGRVSAVKKKKNTTILIILSLLMVVFNLLGVSVIYASPPSVALILGGGSARGLSHIGMIEAFEENGIPIDMLLGTSSGSIIGGLYGAGFSIENMIDICTNLDMHSLIEIPLPPRGGFIDSGRLRYYLDIILEGITLEQLSIPFYPGVVDLGTGRDVALDQGKLSAGILASIAIPGVFPPVEVGGNYYVDGGLKNLVPANLASALGADVIIGVSMGQENRVYKDPEHKSIYNNLRKTINAVMVGYSAVNTAEADVLFVPDIDLTHIYDYENVLYFVERGYQAGIDHMDEIRAAILARDPDFVFKPYKQKGISSVDLANRIEKAKRETEKFHGPLTVKPLLGFDDNYYFSKIGAKVTAGPLKRFGVGYRYGFNDDEGGHELFVDWSHPKIANLDTYFRKSPKREKITWGLDLNIPLYKKFALDAAFVTQGSNAWHVAVRNEAFLNFPHFNGGLALTLKGLRSEGGNLSNEGKLSLSLKPQIKILPWGEKWLPLGPFPLKPYFLAAAEMGTPLNDFSLQTTFKVGLGTDFRILGLFPGELSLNGYITNEGQFFGQIGLRRK